MAQEKMVQEEYCIIQGDNVHVREKPKIGTKVIGKCEKNEFVYCTDRTENKDKIGKDEEYWYKIQRCDNKEGWVYGKYIRYIDSKHQRDKYFKDIIFYEIVDRELCNPNRDVRIYKISYENNHYIVDFEHIGKEKNQKYMVDRLRDIVFYKIIHGKLTETIHMNTYEFVFYKDYILFYSNKGFNIYNTKKYREIYYETHCNNIPCKYYDSTGFYLYENILKNYDECIGNEIKCDSHSEMEFNPETMEVVVYIRKDKDKLLKQEKYKFKDGVFVKVE